MTVIHWINFDKVNASFADNALLRFEVSVDTPLSQQQLWDAFANAGGWPHWFPKVASASYDGAEPYGIGTVRCSLVDAIHYEETMKEKKDAKKIKKANKSR
jgi:hypothetical protein